MELAVAVAIALAVALVTVVLCDLAGSIARAKGSSYWRFFLLGLLLWFPSLIAALALPDRGPAAVRGPGRAETALTALGLAAAVVAVVAGVWGALSAAP